MVISQGPRVPSTIDLANTEMQKAVFGPASEGARQVAGVLSPFGLGWTLFVPPVFQPAFVATVYMQGTVRGMIEAPQHYLNAMSLYTKAATEGVRATAA